MTVNDFQQWLRDRKVCSRGALYARCKCSQDVWRECRRGDWLCWILDWTMEPHPTTRKMWERPWWVAFLRALYGREDLSPEFMFNRFNDWDSVERPTHDQALTFDGAIFGPWDWEAARKAVLEGCKDDPLADKVYEPFTPSPGYRVEDRFPMDYRPEDF